MKRRKFIKNASLLTVGAATLSSLSNIESNSQKIIPKALRKGDTIALVAPAGAIFNSSHITKIEKRLAELGFKTVRGETLSQKEGYLAGSDDLRTNELHQFFKDKSVSAILAMRGGWGCARILDKLDYNLIKENPKIIMGYSDITSLLIAITTKTGLITYHGPVGYSSWKEFSTKEVFNVLVSGLKYSMTNPSEYKNDLTTLTKGVAQGELVGGNLTVLASMIGTNHEPNWHNKILFLEETGEEPYRIDRMLWQLKQANVFNEINGLVLGAFTKCEPEELEKSYSLAEVLDQHFKNTIFPVYKGATIGHIIPKFTLPIGLTAKMDADNFSITLLENAVHF
jgi:muramoyltetrapeptide carboxypeptidase